MVNMVLKSAVASVSPRTAKVIVTFVAIFMALSSTCDFLIEPAYACPPDVLEIDVKENNIWVNRTNQTITVAFHSTVQFKAIPSPSDAQWPEGQPVWGGEATGQTGAEINVAFNSLGQKTVSAGDKLVYVNVVEVQVAKLQWKYHDGLTYTDVPAALHVPKGAQVDFKAVKTQTAAINWPTGKPVWGGAFWRFGHGHR